MKQTNDVMKKFRRRILRGAILKSALAALIIASGVLLVTALASWIFGFKEGIWLAIGLFALSFAGAALLFFFFKYRPTAKDVASKIDAIGLEERLITMMELEGDDSYIARLQRADAKAALAKADHTLIKVAASVALCAVVGVSALFGVGALTVDSLYVAGVIPSAVEAAEYAAAEHDFNVSYTVAQKGGKIYYRGEDGIMVDEEYNKLEVTGKIVVHEGEDAPSVIAVPDPGYAFAGWSDGLYDPIREDKGITSSLSVRATFVETVSLNDLLDDGDGNGDHQDSDSNSEPDPDAPPNQDNGNAPSDETPSSPNQDASGSHSDSNKQVNDGNTYYGDEYGGAYDSAMDRLGSGSDIPGDLQGGVSDYMDSIGKGGSGDGSGGGN